MPLGRRQRTADAIRRWILEQVRQSDPRCGSFDHAFRVVPARGQAFGDWELQPGCPDGPCFEAFERARDEAHRRFELIMFD